MSEPSDSCCLSEPRKNTNTLHFLEFAVCLCFYSESCVTGFR